MRKQILRTIEVKTGIEPSYLEGVLTTDITVLESLFDLIDNSIDAARDHILANDFERDPYGLPKDYSEYSINIRLGKNSISILDNCLGMDESVLTQNAFRIAELSSHKFGIGFYGLGLKRALLKFGCKYAMSTDNGHVAFKMKTSNEMVGGDGKTTADAYQSSGKRKNLFIVSEIKPSIAYEIQNEDWFNNAIRMLNIRYSVYTAKGLRLSISNGYNNEHQRITGVLPSIRTDAKVRHVSKFIKAEGLDVYIDSGVHGKYTFPVEPKYSLATNKTITDQFGLYFICNDRVIVACSTEKEHGWKTKWHSEYNGFVCTVRFVSEDPGKIPWNTLKTALRTDGSVFVRVRDELQPIAESYRRLVKKAYPSSSKNTTSTAPAVGTSSVASTGGASSNAPDLTTGSCSSTQTSPQSNTCNTAAGTAIKNQNRHATNWQTLLPKSFVHAQDAVLNSFVIEAVYLDSNAAPCACAILLRSILEKSLREFIQKSKKFAEVKAHFYASSEGIKKCHSDEQKNRQGLDLSMMLLWIKDERVAVEIFGVEQKPHLWLSAKKAAKHVQKLNGVSHGLELISGEHVRIIRNEIYPLLSFLVFNCR